MASDPHALYRDNIPAYALGALEGEELTALEAHLQSCAVCQAELAAYRELRDSLLMAVPPQVPSATLRRNLQARLPRVQRRARPRSNWSFGPLAAGLALALLLFMNALSLLQLRSLQTEQARLSRQIRTSQAVMSMLAYPATQRLNIPSDQSVVGSVLVDMDRDIVAIIVWHMPELPEDQTYQAWLIDANEQRVSAGTFRPEGDEPYTTKLLYPKQTLADFVAVGVTIEPAPGSATPSGERVLRVDF